MTNMTNWRTVCAAIVVAAIFASRVAGQSSSPATSTSKPAAKGGAEHIRSIVLPQYPPEIAAGPNVQVYEQRCLICHTARYVSMQPPFSKTVWESEVKKMVDAYGAPISEADQALIVEYLVSVKGIKTSVITAAPTK